LIEAVVAVSLLAAGVSAVAQVCLFASSAVRSAQSAGIAQQAARDKLEQLRALTWSTDAAGLNVQDVTTDLTRDPPGPSGGPGLSTSPGDTLASNVAGYCDFLDENGLWVSGGTSAPQTAAWVRRWSIEPVDALVDTVMLQVVVVPVRVLSSQAALAAARATNGAWLVAIRTRSTP
jgi:hypothetical protein